MPIKTIDGNSYTEYIATCDNADCGNFEIPLKVWGSTDYPEIGCGACDKHSIPYIES